MEKLLFGISGLPIGGSKKMTYAGAIDFLQQMGLDAMELPFVRSVNVSEKNRDEILRASKMHDFYLSAHGSYFINLNAKTSEVQDASRDRIIDGALALRSVGGRSLVFHPGYYLDCEPHEAYAQIKDNLDMLPDLDVDYRLETTGKGTQFGTIEELVALCKEVPACRLCIDFAHIHARGNGCLLRYNDFASILQHVADELGQAALADLHIHLAGIAYSPRGEIKHLPLEESDFNYRDCLKALRDFSVAGCVICESPTLESDAMLLKRTFMAL